MSLGVASIDRHKIRRASLDTGRWSEKRKRLGDLKIASSRKERQSVVWSLSSCLHLLVK
jgi:hypothetical protein